MTELDDAARAAAAGLPSRWVACLIPYDVPTEDGRVIARPRETLFAELHRPLPLPLIWVPGADPDAPEGAHGLVVGRVEELWHTRAGGAIVSADRDELWGAGSLDLAVPGFAELVAAAWRLRGYGLGLPIGVNIDDMVVTEVDDEHGPHLRFDRFRLIGAAINTSAGWPAARLTLIDAPGVVPASFAEGLPHPEA